MAFNVLFSLVHLFHFSFSDEAQKIIDLAEAWSKAKEQQNDEGEEETEDGGDKKEEKKKDEEIQKELGAPEPPGFKVDRAKDIVELLST